MQAKIEGGPSFAHIHVDLSPGETIIAESDAMSSMAADLDLNARLNGGFLSALAKKFLGGESLFINEFTARGGPGEIKIAPGAPGDLEHVHLDGDVIYLQSSAFVAGTPDVAVESKWQGMMKGFFSGESLFLIRCSGRGDLWFNTYGAMLEVDVAGNYVVDTGFVVAFTEGLQYDVGRVGGYKSLFFSGEGLVCRFRGQGKVWIQTRQVPAFAWWTLPFRRVKKG